MTGIRKIKAINMPPRLLQVIIVLFILLQTAQSQNASATTQKTTTTTSKQRLMVNSLIAPDIVVLHLDIIKEDPHTLISAMKVATDLINENPRILPGYELFVNTSVQPDPTVTYIARPVMELIQIEKTQTLALVGPLYSEQLEAAREIISGNKIALLQANIGATDPAFSSKELNPHVFSLTPSYASLSTAIVHLFKKFKWKRVGIIYNLGFVFSANTDRDIKVVEEMSKKFKKSGITIVAKESVPIIRDISSKESKKEIVRALTALKEKDIRIIIGVFHRHTVGFILCQAHKLNMTSPKYYWILTNYVANVLEQEDFDCNLTEFRDAFKNVMIPRVMGKRLDNIETVANMKVDKVWEMIKEKRRKIEVRVQNKSALVFDERSLYAFDTIWTLALGLDRVFKKYKYTRTSFSYSNFESLNRLADEIENVSFQGMTGFIRFDPGQRGRVVDYTKFEIYGLNASFTHVGTYNAENDVVEYDTSLQQQLFPDGYVIPTDGITTIHIPECFSTRTLAVVWTLTGLATLLSLYFLGVNFMHRQTSLIKMSSPNINNLIVAGCILCYLAVILYGLDAKLIDVDKIHKTCNAIVFCLTFGFTLAFGALFSKTWRIYRIFTTARTLQIVAIRDMHLFGVIFLMLCVDSVILTTWMLTSPYELKVERIDFQIYPEFDQIHEKVIYRCNCHLQIYYGVAIFLYKGILLIFGLFLAWETRKIEVAVINDSKYIGMAVYNVGVLVSVGSISSFALYQTLFYTELYVVFALCILFCTTFTLIIVFAPKVKMMQNNFEDPNFRNGRPVLNSTEPSQRGFNSTIYNKSEGSTAEFATKRNSPMNSHSDFQIHRKGTVESDFSDEQEQMHIEHKHSVNSNSSTIGIVPKYS